MSKWRELKQESLDLLDTYNFDNIDANDVEDLKQIIKNLMGVVGEAAHSGCNIYGYCNSCAAVKSLHDTIALLHKEKQPPSREDEK